MLSFPLIPGDKYEGRCAEIYITEKQFLVYHCSICDEIYATFIDLLSHITKDHYENIKEYHDEEEATSVATVKKSLKIHTNENTFTKQELMNTETHNTPAKGDLNTEIVKKGAVLTILKNDGLILDKIKSPQRKKERTISGILRNYALNRTKLNTLTRGYQLNSNEESKFICSLCGFAFKDKLNLRTHILRHSNQRNINCSVCSKKFYTKSELRQHEYRHKTERPYLCKHCGMGFLNKQSQTQHVQNLHSQQSTTQCEQKNQWLKTREEEHHQPNGRDSDFEPQSQDYKKSDLKIHNRNQYNNNTSITQKDNRGCSTAESKLSLIESSDEYELVQTLTDFLECNKNE